MIASATERSRIGNSSATSRVEYVWERVISRLNLMAWLYPPVLVSSLYVTWFVAWLVLGHPPRPSLDDPKSISVVVDVCYYFPGCLLIGFPAALIGGAGLQLCMPNRSWITRLLSCVALLMMWIAVVAFLRYDPLTVAEWYMD